jgi:hypothetical protein
MEKENLSRSLEDPANDMEDDLEEAAESKGFEDPGKREAEQGEGTQYSLRRG